MKKRVYKEMPNQDWKFLLIKEAKEYNMCTENFKALYHTTFKDEAVRLYKKTINWALEREFPSLDVLRQDFSDMEDEGLFIDKNFKGDILMDKQYYVFHNCKGTIKVGLNKGKKIIPVLYIANGCELNIEGIEINSPIPLSINIISYGDNKVFVEQKDNVKYVITNKQILSEEEKYNLPQNNK